MEKQKICFVIMGFGEKKDPETNRTINLDITYKEIIRPAIEACGVMCVRADEIIESGIIDRSMYALLYRADIVIADITTNNPNAIYELGVRHSLKPYSTVIIKEGKGLMPFDFGHNRVLYYEHLGNEISKKEIIRCKRELKLLVETIIEKPTIDSPLYTYIPKISQPTLSDVDLAEIIGELENNENTIYALTEKANKYKKDKKFTEAAEVWKQLCERVENENYYIQQQALCTYKSNHPSELVALSNALTIISKISEANDTETLGITGAIHKNLWFKTNDVNYLNYAISSYEKGWNLYKDYYTGENYAFCMFEKSEIETGDKQIYYKVAAEIIFEEIIDILLKELTIVEPDELMWKYASLSNCYLANGDSENANIYEQKFMDENPEEWQIDSFNKTKYKLIKK